MSTYVADFVNKIVEKWEEVDILLSMAVEKQNNKQEKLYNALCRSVTVLMVAHFEGFTKDMVKAVIADLNANCKFINMPEAIKRTYCKKYYGNLTDEINKPDHKIQMLKEKFEQLDCTITYEPFLFPGNKNPNSKTIQTVCSNFGIQKIFNYLHESELANAAFTESNLTLVETLGKIKEVIMAGIEDFPYDCNIKEFKLTFTEFNKKTLWEEFLDDLNQKRHDVAHGNNFLNTVDIVALKNAKDKIMLLEFALVGIICEHINQNSKLETSNEDLEAVS